MTQEKNRSKKGLAIAAVVLAVAVVAAVFVYRYLQKEEPQANAGDILVEVLQPTVGTLTSHANFSGKIQPDEFISVYPKGVGEVKAVYVAPGDTVKKGDLLFELDSEAAKLTYNQALAAYNSAAAQVEQMTGSTLKGQQYSAEISEDQSYDALEQARDAVEMLEEAVSGIKSLQVGFSGNPLLIASPQGGKAIATAIASVNKELSEDISSKVRDLENGDAGAMAFLTADDTVKDVKDALQEALTATRSNLAAAKAGEETARTYYKTARKSYELMTSQMPEELKKVADATMAQAMVGLEAAEYQLSLTKVYAPIDGVVESIIVTENNAVSTQMAACVLSNKEVMTVTASLPAGVADGLRIGDTLTVTYNGKSCPATVSQVATAPGMTGLYDIKAVLTEGSPVSLSGVRSKISVPTGRAENTMILPISALYYEDNVPYVYLLQDGRAVKTFIETGIASSTEVAVLSGLDADAQVIASWHPNLIDGVAVTVVSVGE